MNMNPKPSAGPRNRRSSDRRLVDRNGAAAMVPVLMKVLDEIDHGLMLIDTQGRMAFANQLALAELRGDSGLQLAGGRLSGRTPVDQTALHTALADAQRGRRRLFTAGSGDASGVSVAAIPMSEPGESIPTGQPCVLLVFGKRQAVEGLTADFFARGSGLTPAETVVLKSLCAGAKPKEIAAGQSIAISTVRSHIASIRAKTQAVSIADLVNRVAVLPPLTSAVKTVASPVQATPDVTSCDDAAPPLGSAPLRRRPSGGSCAVRMSA